MRRELLQTGYVYLKKKKKALCNWFVNSQSAIKKPVQKDILVCVYFTLLLGAERLVTTHLRAGFSLRRFNYVVGKGAQRG